MLWSLSSVSLNEILKYSNLSCTGHPECLQIYNIDLILDYLDFLKSYGTIFKIDVFLPVNPRILLILL